MTIRTSLVSALLLSAAFVVPAAAAGDPGTAPAGTTATTPQATTPAPATAETPPTDVTESGTAMPAEPTTAATPAPAAPTTASSTEATAPVTAQAGATVKGANGVTLGTVASSDAQGNIQLATDSGNVALAPGLVKNVNGELQANAISRKDLMAMAATQRGDQEAAQQASTRRGLRYRAGPPRVQTSAPAPAEQTGQPAAPAMPADQTPSATSPDAGETQAPATEAKPGTEPQ